MNYNSEEISCNKRAVDLDLFEKEFMNIVPFKY
jgi:hypothetical protein